MKEAVRMKCPDWGAKDYIRGASSRVPRRRVEESGEKRQRTRKK